ncbi:MAG TPA: hypothetical protein ENK21_07450 [Trueperaceae bacterium]|nr:hypothetical protein [Trueperaceae bacterium]
MKNNNPPKNYVHLGKLGKTFQLAGGLRFYGLGAAEEDAIFELDEVYIEDFGKTNIREAKEMGKNIIVYFSRAFSVDSAKSLVNKAVWANSGVLRSELSFVDQIINLDVFLDQNIIGRVKEIIDSKNPIIVVETATTDILIPLDAPYVEIKNSGIFLKEVPEGLIDLNQ